MKGVIVGCSREQEWLLPWWWMHYVMHCQFPVTFFDLGDMSPQAKEWCSARGEVKELKGAELTLEERKAALWGSRKSLNLPKAREAWFQKPVACLQSPYESTLWLDLDCQVCRPLEPLFPYCDNEWGLSLAEDPQQEEHRGYLLPDEVEYNTGVIVFRKGAPLLHDWALTCLERHEAFRGDQEAFSRLLYERKIRLPAFPAIYNAPVRFSPESSQVLTIEHAFVMHWTGIGKEFIRQEIAFLKEKAFMNFEL